MSAFTIADYERLSGLTTAAIDEMPGRDDDAEVDPPAA